MTKTEFIEKWHSEKPIYEAWGAFVKKTIEDRLREADSALDLGRFLKIANAPRLKEDDSLIEKAFHRDKPYEDPYLEITDKVGLRLVVLLTEDITRIQRIIERCELWSFSLDRDYEQEREARPLEFAYQSKHYVVRSNVEVFYSGITVPIGVPCEIQLRTLLQHAHSELTHDNIYKVQQGTTVTNQVRRTVAKSMALIEAVDDFFCSAIVQLAEATAPERETYAFLAKLYQEKIGIPHGNGKTNQIVLHAFRERLTPDLQHEVAAFLEQHAFIAEQVRKHAKSQQLFRQPWVLLAYYLVQQSPRQTKEQWPLTFDEIEPIYTDLGKNVT